MRVGTSCISVPTFLLVALLAVGVASAQPFTNGSFTTVPTSGNPVPGWTAAGNPVISVGTSTPTSSPYNLSGTVYSGPAIPTAGTNQVLLNSTGATAPGIYANSNSVLAITTDNSPSLDSVLGTTLPSNMFQGVTNQPVNGQAISQTFSTTNGATITFSYAYESRETPGNGFDETGYVLNGVFHILADTNTPNQSSANHTEFLTGGIPYQTVTLTVGPGPVTLGFVAYNTGNTSAPSGLFIDNVVVTPLPTNYTALDPSGSINTFATGVSGNNIVGFYEGNDLLDHAFFYDGTTFFGIDPPGSHQAEALGISGQNVVGSFFDSNGVEHGFLYDGATSTTLDPPGSSLTVATAASGNNVVGWFVDSTGEHGFLYDGSSYTPLDPPNSSPADNTTTATAVSGNNVVGYYKNTIDGQVHGFLFNGTTYTDINQAGSTDTRATAISGSNVVGTYVDSSGQHGFLFNGSTYTTIDPTGTVAGSADTTITGISGNNVVGYFNDTHTEHGFFYDGTTYTILDPSTSTDTQVTGISGHNVVGSYLDTFGVNHGFLTGVGKTVASINLDNLFQAWDGTPKSATVITTPGSLDVIVTYTGTAGTSYSTSTTPPTNVGSYTVTASILDPDYQGSATGTLTVGKATATIDFGTTTFVYNGSPQPLTITTTPPGVSITLNYSGTNYPSSTTAPTNVGTYSVVPTVNDPNYQVFAGANLTITQATATVTLVPGSLTATFDGTPKPVSATTSPTPNLNVTFTYNGGSAAPSGIGTYTVVATVNDPNYVGSTTGTLTISGDGSTVSFSDWEHSFNNFSGDRSVATWNDGVPNLLKYLYDIDPSRPMTVEDRAALPMLDRTTIGNVDYLTLTFREYGYQTGVNVVVQSSTDLVNWSTPTNAFLQVMEIDGNTHNKTMVAGVPINVPGKTFIRLNVEGP